MENQSSAFSANLYVNGLPVVLNQQRLRARLRDLRITQRERLDIEVALASSDGTEYLTLADHEDDKPLLLKFVPQGKSYSVMAVLKGAYDGSYLDIKPQAHQLIARSGFPGAGFTIAKYGVENANFSDLENGPSYVYLRSAADDKALYLANDKGKLHFKDVDPNVSRHDAYNNKPVTFVLKTLGKPGQTK